MDKDYVDYFTIYHDDGTSDDIYCRDTESQNNINDINKDIDTIKKQIYNITREKENVILFGDSWVDYNSNTKNVAIPGYIADSMGVTVHNYSHGGTGFIYPKTGYMSQLDDFSNDSTFDHNNIKYCILVAGLNEYNPQTSQENFTIFLQNWYDKARKLTNAPIYWFFDYSMINDIRPTLSRTYAPQRDYFDYISRHVNRNIVCVNMQGWVEWSRYANRWNTDNWYHPLYQGSIDVAQNMVSVLQGAPVTIYPYAFITATWNNTANPNFSKTQMEFSMIGAQLYVRYYTPTYCAAGTPSAYSFVPNYSHPLPANLTDYSVSIAKNVYVEGTDKTSNDGNATITIIKDSELSYSNTHSGYTLTGAIECLYRN